MGSQTEKAINEVDVSSDRVNQEWSSIEADEGLQCTAIDDETGEVKFTPHPDDETAQRKGIVERLAVVMGAAFSFGFAWFAPAWKVNAEECSGLAVAWSRVAAKYIPFAWLQWIPDISGGEGSECLECDAIAITFRIVKPRLGTPTQNTQNSESPGATSQDGQESGGMMFSRTDG